jgi:hypothetical protein
MRCPHAGPDVRQLNRLTWLLPVVIALATGSVYLRGQDAAPTDDLSTIFTIGRVLQDRNGDGTVDFVDARIVLGETPTADERAAAADVALRLGFETSALTLPLVGEAATGATVFAIGRAALERSGLDARQLELPALGRGEGLVRVARVDDVRYVIVLGGDGPGLRTAARVLAGRVPAIWDAKGPGFDAVARDVSTLLEAAKVTGASVDVPEVHVRAGAQGIDRVVVAVRLSALGDMTSTMLALQRVQQERSRSSVESPSLSYEGARTVTIRLAAPDTPSVSIDVARASTADPAAPTGRRPGLEAKESLDLSNLYTKDGLLGDSDSNLIPDRVDAMLLAGDTGTDRIVDLAARLGLESTGITVPLVGSGVPETPESEPPLVIVGETHPLIDRLVEAGKLDRGSLGADEGEITVVRRAFGERTALVITGGGEAGVDRALAQVAERLPHIWQRGNDRTTLDDVEEDVRRFVSGRSPAGQAAMALYKADRLAAALARDKRRPTAVRAFVEQPDPGFAAYFENHVQRRFDAGPIATSVEPLDVVAGSPIAVGGRPISEDVPIASEVDEFWQLFNARVLKETRRNRPVFIEARLSEPPDVRARIEQEVREALAARRVDPAQTEVRILSAYKQGYSWLYDVVRPALADREIGEIVIGFARLAPPDEWPQQAVFTPTRWLLELFPIDEVLARDLGVGLERIRFEERPAGSPAYEVVVTGPAGAEILRDTFEPKVVLRPYFDRFPDYEHVRVTTGWITARVGDKTVADERIATDPERFWDHFQSRTLPAIYDYVMAMTEGKPRAADAPHFAELRVEVSLSEPDYALGIDKEQIASMEALHEDIYFGVLHFFDVLGRFSRGPALAYPGRVIPVMRPKADGKAGHATIAFTGFGATRPSVTAAYDDEQGRSGTLTLDVPRIAVERPEALSARVRAGEPGIARLGVRIKVDTSADEREALVARARAERVDETILSAEQVEAMLRHLGEMQKAGLYAGALAYHDLGTLSVSAGWTHAVDVTTSRRVDIGGAGRPAPFPEPAALLEGSEPGGQGPLVQWDTPIPPREAHALLARMGARFREATVYKVGESYLGQDIWAMDLMPPIEATHWSQAKATTLKPTIVYTARQHANEVSSTSHVLRLAERLLTVPAERAKLDKVNVVVHPITNPDGAQLAYDLYRITPDHMLHAGYLGSLGVDVTQNQWEADPLYPETAVRPTLWRTWLPDIVLNPHGYPSHEWVQLFSEYAGWVRNRVTESRDWWGMRGWFMPGFAYVDDPKYPRHKEAAFAIRERIVRAINAVPELRALNERAYDRYRRYGFRFDSENFKMDLVDGVLIYTAIKGTKPDPRADDVMARQPNVTIWSGTTEAPDETAHGDWLRMVAQAGLQFDTAVLDWLVEQPHKVERTVTPFAGGTALMLSRARPPKPPEADAPEPSAAPQARSRR